jgi:hypothetical protein
MPTIKLAEGNGRSVLYWSPRTLTEDHEPFCDCPRLTREDLKSIFWIISEHFIKQGSFPKSKQKFKKLEGEDELHEIKSFQHRLLGGYDKGRSVFVIVLCVKKKKDKLEPSQVKSARNNLRRYREECSK